MKAIIFGANGQDGYYLSQLLREKNIEVLGVSRKGDWIRGDVTDFLFVTELIKNNRPDFIFHLAANSTTAHEVWQENHNTICNGTLYILESVYKHSPHSKVFISGSGLQFVNNNIPIKETDAFDATSPYAVSRIQSVYAARYYRSLGINAYTGYFFNHESPLRSSRHMSKKIAEFAKAVQQGKDDKLEIGDITVKKEWAFAGDIVKGIWSLVTQGNVSEAVIGSGLAYSIADWLDTCFAIIDKDWKPYVSLKQGFTPEYNCLVSDPATMKQLGWQTETSFEQLAKIMMS